MIREQIEYVSEYDYNSVATRRRRVGRAALVCFVLVGIGLWVWLSSNG